MFAIWREWSSVEFVMRLGWFDGISIFTYEESLHCIRVSELDFRVSELDWRLV